jgi:hypothetical protein
MILLTALALAATLSLDLPVQGQLTDAGGAPVDGARAVTLRVHTAETGGSPVATSTRTVQFTGGAFSIDDAGLGSIDLGASPTSVPDLWVSLQLDGGVESARVRVAVPPHARFADLAGRAARADAADLADDALHAANADRATAADLADQASNADRATAADLADDASALGGVDAARFLQDTDIGRLLWSLLDESSMPDQVRYGLDATDGVQLDGTTLSIDQTWLDSWAQGIPRGAEVTSARPTTGLFAGRLIYNTGAGALEVWDGAAWRSAGTGASGPPPGGFGGGGDGTVGSPGRSCRQIREDLPGSSNGNYWIDVDGSGATPAFRTWCDMGSGGLTLVANVYDNAGDDVPNALSTLAGGWQQTGPGAWTGAVTDVRNVTGANASAAVSPEVVKQMFMNGATTIRFCLVSTSGAEICRASDTPSASLTIATAPSNVVNTTLAAYRPGNCSLGLPCHAAYTYGRLAGIPASRNDLSFASFSATTFCIQRTEGVASEFGLESPGLCEHNHVGWHGVWHAWGNGISFRPWDTGSDELGNGLGADPSAASYGFRIWVGGRLAGLGTASQPAASCHALRAANNALPNGYYWIDADGSGSLPGFQTWCDMATGNTLVANIYDSPGDDVPNNVGLLASGWQQDGAGGFTTSVTGINRAIGAGVSGAVSADIVKKLFDNGATRLRFCYVSTSDGEICRSTDSPSARLVFEQAPATLVNTKLRTYRLSECPGGGLACNAAYTYGRLAGIPGSRDDLSFTTYYAYDYCIGRSTGASGDFGDSTEGFCEHNSLGWQGVWHGWGSGTSLRPWDTAEEELGNANGANPSGAAYGYRLYVGGGNTRTLGTASQPAASCRAIWLEDASRPNAHYWIDPDGGGAQAATQLWCDIENGGWTVIGNLVDTPRDDMPNTPATWASTWASSGLGTWETNANAVHRGRNSGQSAALAPEIVRMMFQSGAYTNLRVCLVSVGDQLICRSTDDGTLTLATAPAGTVNTTLAPFRSGACVGAQSACNAAYTYGRLVGLPGTRNDFTWASFGSPGYCVLRATGVANEFGTDGTGMCENSDPSWHGVWHGWGNGISLRPYDTSNNELGNNAGADPSAASWGLRLMAR